jgi:lipoyl(octanoyl) transferase
LPVLPALPALASARWAWLGRVPFEPTVTVQESLRQRVLAGTGPETLLLLEHEPVITLGRSAEAAHILLGASELQRRGIALHQASRGGDVTYHGPGQLVGYPVVRLDRGVVGHLRAMADGLIEVLARFGIVAVWRRDAPGLWVDNDSAPPSKICSFGVNVHRRVCIHGFALNVGVDLDAFRAIVPCGLAGVTMTSMGRLIGHTPPLEALASEVASAFNRSFRRAFAREESADVMRDAREADDRADDRADVGDHHDQI